MIFLQKMNLPLPGSLPGKWRQLRAYMLALILYAGFSVWFLFWLFSVTEYFIEQAPYYRAALGSSWEELRANQCTYDETSRDFYTILKYCEKTIPVTNRLKVILPADPADRHVFWREKARYYLYPRNFGNNEKEADYILVYGLSGFKIPQSYVGLKRFSADQYLLRRRLSVDRDLLKKE